MTRIFLLAALLILTTPVNAQRITGKGIGAQWQFCVKVAQVTHQPCRIALDSLRTFMNSQPVVQISTPLTLIDVDLNPLSVDIPRERHFHRRRHR
jgi:hypothetical protein